MKGEEERVIWRMTLKDGGLDTMLAIAPNDVPLLMSALVDLMIKDYRMAEMLLSICDIYRKEATDPFKQILKSNEGKNKQVN